MYLSKGKCTTSLLVSSFAVCSTLIQNRLKNGNDCRGLLALKLFVSHLDQPIGSYKRKETHAL